MDNIIIKLSFIKKAIKKGNRKKAANAEIADTRNIKKTNNQIESMIRPIYRSSANKIPNEVATPLPPLNFKKIENICPIKIKNDEK